MSQLPQDSLPVDEVVTPGSARGAQPLAASALDALIATERALEERLAQARAEAERIVAEAEREAERRSAAFERQLREDLEELERTHLERRARRLSALQATASEQTAKLASIGEDTLAAIAKALLDEFFEGRYGTGTAGPRQSSEALP
jgi:vacuolar-type H+-ATPase subunit H